MFGTYRYILAAMVALHHLWHSHPTYIGTYGVYGFYMLSGYLMTLVLNEVYGFSSDGTIRFLTNRALRIYPSYIIAMLFSLTVILLTQDTATLQPIITKLGELTTMEWLSNIFIFGLTSKPYPIVPPAWSLSVELFLYIAMALFLARQRHISILWFLLSLSYTIYMVAIGTEFPDRYFPIVAASLPFSIGSLIYHYRYYFNHIPKWSAAITGSMFILNGIAARYLWDDVKFQGFYVSIILSALLLISLINIKKNDVPFWFYRFDKFLGNLSYPIFLLHWHVATFVSWSIFAGSSMRGKEIFLISFVFTNILAYLMNYLLENKVNRIRNKIRYK